MDLPVRRTKRGSPVIELPVQVDAAAMDAIGQIFDAMNGSKTFTLSFRKSRLLDVLGLEALISLGKKAEEMGQKIVLTGMSTALFKVFKVAKQARFFEIVHRDEIEFRDVY